MMRSASSATATVLTTTRPIASIRIGRSFDRNKAQSVAQPPEKSSGGKIERKIQSGEMRTGGNPGTNASAVPDSTNTIGYGSAKRFATTARATAAASPQISNSGALIARSIRRWRCGFPPGADAV